MSIVKASPPFYIFGAGGHAKCVFNAAIESRIEPSAFIVDHPNQNRLFETPILDVSRISGEFQFVVGIGDFKIRREKFNLLRFLGGVPVTIIHPAASVSRYATIGAGTVILSRAMIDPSVRIGENAIINVGALIGHDCIVEDDAHVSAGAVVGAMSHVGVGAFVGIGALINPGVDIGRECFIAMGALVNHDVPAFKKAISPNKRECLITEI